MGLSVVSESSVQIRPAKRRAPGPRGQFLLGSLPEFRRDMIGLLEESVRQHGDVVRFRFGPVTAHLVNHPDHVEHVLLERSDNYDKRTRSVAKIRTTCGNSLLASDGEPWRRHRRLIQPAFRQEYLQRFLPVIAEITSRTLQRWQDFATAGEAIDVVSEMMQLTLKIAARIFFGTDVKDDAAVIEHSLAVILRDTWRRLETPFDLAAISPAFRRPAFRRALREIDGVVYRIIEDRRRDESASDDLLSMLLEAHEGAGEKGLDDRELRDAVITLLLAGHETTANALAWTFYLVSQSEDVEERLLGEAAAESGESAGNRSYVSMVFAETIRFYPSIWIMERHVRSHDEIGGYHIPAGSTVMISPYLLHRHPEFWDEPEVFDPDRFADEPDTFRSRCSYVPFGIGPHQCIGQQMALLVARHVLRAIYQRFHLQLVPGQTIGMEPGITLRHGGRVLMTLERHS